MAQDPVTPSPRTPPDEFAEPERARAALRDPDAAGGMSSLLAPPTTAPVEPPGARVGPFPQPVPAPSRLPSAATAAPTAHAAYLAQRRFAALDGLRALAILAVVWHHTVGGPGRLGANLFFLLSGFLVTTVLVRERARRGTLDVRAFRARRARRLYPLYFTVLAAYVGIVAAFEPAGAARSAFFAHLPAFASFTSNLFVALEGERTIFYFAWSLAAQEQFYLLWPLYLRHLELRSAAAALLSLLAAVYLTRAGVFDLALPPGTWLRALVLSVLPALLLGALLALALDARSGFEALRRWLGARWSSVALLAAALWIWCTPGVPEPIMHLVLSALTAACVLREDHALAHFLRRSWIVHVGSVSYGVYLLHMLCHNAVERGLARLGSAPAVLDFALTALLAVGLATLSQRHFERRFLRRRSGAEADVQARSIR